MIKLRALCGGGTWALAMLLVAGVPDSAAQGTASISGTIADESGGVLPGVTVTAMAMGEAAGVAAAISLKDKTSVAELNGAKVREQLESQNAGPFTDA